MGHTTDPISTRSLESGLTTTSSSAIGTSTTIEISATIGTSAVIGTSATIGTSTTIGTPMEGTVEDLVEAATVAPRAAA